ncbi:unnamed protein product [Prunus armeniaca]|uniref:Uncharacterized protein n=1 Tax=Prunus armeniaca TaxID=36596 RepID=A0A6J5XX07_PRUAR|nr:unnamed protein product [Prunus armeniaca]
MKHSFDSYPHGPSRSCTRRGLSSSLDPLDQDGCPKPIIQAEVQHADLGQQLQTVGGSQVVSPLKVVEQQLFLPSRQGQLGISVSNTPNLVDNMAILTLASDSHPGRFSSKSHLPTHGPPLVSLGTSILTRSTFQKNYDASKPLTLVRFAEASLADTKQLVVPATSVHSSSVKQVKGASDSSSPLPPLASGRFGG